MINNFFNRLNLKNATVALIATAGLFFSCAEEEEKSYYQIESEHLDKYVASNYPDFVESENLNGVYFKFHKNSGVDTVPTYKNSNFLKVKFSGQDLSGNYFYNMYPDRADTLGQYSYYNNYSSKLVQTYSMSLDLCEAQAEALQYMNPGDSVEIISSSESVRNGYILSFIPIGFYGNIGFSGNPSMFKMKLDEFIPNINSYERKEVQTYASQVLHMSKSDTLDDASLIYLDIEDITKNDTIPDDTIVYINYVGRFTDGFVFDTNIDSVALAHNIYDTSSDKDRYTPLAVNINESGSDVVKGMDIAIRNMRFGESATTVFTSPLGYGSYGSSGSKTEIQPYTPLVFEITILKDYEE